MKLFKTVLITCLPLLSFSIDLELNKFEWEKTPAIHALNKDEQSQAALILEDQREIEFIYNTKNELEEYLFQHKVVHINESKAVDDFNKIYISVGSAEDLIVFKARSIDKNGKVKEMSKSDMKEIDDKGNHYLSIAVDGLEKDCEVEYFYVKKIRTSYFRSMSVDTDFRTRKCGFRFISPENIVVEGKAYNGLPQFDDTLIDTKRFLSMSAKDIVSMPEEQYATNEANQKRIEVKVAKNLTRGESRLFTWADGGNRYYDICCRLEKDEKKEVEKLIDKMKLKKKTDIETIRAIENYVKTSYDVTEEVNFRNVTDIVKNKYADDIGICRVFSGLLKATGIKFELIVTVSRFKKKFDPDFDTWNNFEDIIYYFPTENVYMSPVNYAYRAGLLPAEYIGESGLFIKEIIIGDISSAVSSVKKIPLPDTDVNGDSLDVSIEFSSDLKTVNQKTYHSLSGYPGIFTKALYFYSPEDKKKEQMTNMLKFGIEDAVVTNEKALNYDLATDDVDKPFVLTGNLKYTSLVEKAGDIVLFNVGAVIGPQVQMYNEKPRQQPIDIQYLHVYSRKISIKIPDGYTVKELEALKMNITSNDATPPTMGFISNYEVKNNILEIYIKEYYNQISYPVSFFEVYKTVINASADFNKIKIAFEKK